MHYSAELSFFRSMLEQAHLPCQLIGPGVDTVQPIDMGLRKLLGVSLGEDRTRQLLLEHMRPNTIYKIKDPFFCQYVCLLLPGEPGAPAPTGLVIGPYTQVDVSYTWLEEQSRRHGFQPQWLPMLETYFSGVIYLPDDDPLFLALHALAERLWGHQQYTVEDIVDGLPDWWHTLAEAPDPDLQEDAMMRIQVIERRYAAEAQLIQAVSQGRAHRAELMLSGFSQAAIENRAGEPLRNWKNYLIVLNTLLRKAAELGAVHPLHLDRLSSEYARRVEHIASWQDTAAMSREMVQKYSLLVKKYSMKEYSSLVQKVLTRIDFDLAADLSLKAHAAALNVNASYLSTLFKKETGVTLTDYVNRKRVEHATFLLRTTDLPVSVIGHRCGIQDDNYFTKIFKKYAGVTPKQYRQSAPAFSGGLSGESPARAAPE